jgi:HD superfamily phosphodiesterase
MIETHLTLEDIIQTTLRVGEDWAIAHAKRLLVLVKQIGVDIPYDSQILEFAVYMHDWGAFPTYAIKDVEHAVRSRQVVEMVILPLLDLRSEQKTILLEAIELHDYRDMRPVQSNEALLLREADMLEFIGMIGMAREFARGPKNLETCTRRAAARRDGVQSRFTIPRAQSLARIRLERMEQCFRWLEDESFGIL